MGDTKAASKSSPQDGQQLTKATQSAGNSMAEFSTPTVFIASSPWELGLISPVNLRNFLRLINFVYFLSGMSLHPSSRRGIFQFGGNHQTAIPPRLCRNIQPLGEDRMATGNCICSLSVAITQCHRLFSLRDKFPSASAICFSST